MSDALTQALKIASIEDELDLIAQEFEKTSEINRGKEMELWHQMKAGDPQARTDLLMSLRPLVVRAVNKFSTNSNIPRAVLEAKAYTLIDKALPSFNPAKAQMNIWFGTGEISYGCAQFCFSSHGAMPRAAVKLTTGW